MPPHIDQRILKDLALDMRGRDPINKYLMADLMSEAEKKGIFIYIEHGMTPEPPINVPAPPLPIPPNTAGTHILLPRSLNKLRVAAIGMFVLSAVTDWHEKEGKCDHDHDY